MNILVIDEDRRDRRRLKQFLRKALPDMSICAFDNYDEALEFAEESPIGAAFIDIEKSIHTPGYFLAKNILDLQKTNIVFTNYEWVCTQEALRLRVSGYIRKPLQYEEILKELENLRYPLAQVGVAVIPPPDSGKTRHSLLNKIANLF